ncbi:hypothetical protein [Streptomyces sp. WAC06614]|uniref:hypothetical protein n=1 Tax=Streptomyces sp. WAC06614 TaxID=2487416 RepID=UPI00163C78CA|nr:hypothetical protein [Streptomyces sp. WAC06614]
MRRVRRGSWDRVLGRLLAPAPRSWWVVALLAVLTVAVSTSLRENGGSDNAFVVKAADALLDGVSPYEDKRFLYLPSAVLLAVPEALLPTPVLRWVLPLVMSALLAAGWWAALRLFGMPVRSRFAVGGWGVLAALYSPYLNLVLIGNWTSVSAAALPVALLLAHRGRWTVAAAGDGRGGPGAAAAGGDGLHGDARRIPGVPSFVRPLPPGGAAAAAGLGGAGGFGGPVALVLGGAGAAGGGDPGAVAAGPALAGVRGLLGPVRAGGGAGPAVPGGAGG